MRKGDISPMTMAVTSLKTPRVNPDWAKLPLFDRTGWTRFAFGDVAENVNETVRAGRRGGRAIYRAGASGTRLPARPAVG